jgi:glutathione S-transferase
MLTEHIRDIKQKYYDAKAGKSGEELKAIKTSWLKNELPSWAAKLEACVGKDGFAVGNRLSLADVTIIQLFFTDYFDDKDKEWYATRPQTFI